MMRYAPDIATADSFTLQATEYSSSDDESGTFTPIDEVLDTLGNPLPLIENDMFSAGSVVFFRLTDLDQNLDPAVVESVFLTITVPDSNDLEFIRIYETGPNTGIFIDDTDTGTNPVEADTDGDTLEDGVERATGVFLSSADPGTHPLTPDSDADGLTDGATIIASVMVGAACCVAMSQATDLMLDLKTGYLVGAIPKKQQIAQFLFQYLGIQQLFAVFPFVQGFGFIQAFVALQAD